MPKTSKTRASRAALLVGLLCSTAQAQPSTLLTRDRIAHLARNNAPQVQIAMARVGEAAALHVGTGAWATVNPELGFVGGPHYIDPARPTTEVTLKLQWPIDISGARGARQDTADAAEALAQADLQAVTRLVVAEALAAAMRTHWAAGRLDVENQRTALDQQLLHVAEVRRAAGAAGDGDVALARVLAAESQARQSEAAAARDAEAVMLRQVLGLADDAPVSFEDDAASPIDLDTLLQHVSERADLVASQARITLDSRDADLQRRLGVPLPRINVDGGRMPEWFVEAGLSMPLPVYQRNQTNRAVAEARVHTSTLGARLSTQRAVAEVRAAYATYRGSVDALAALQAAEPAIDDAAHLATRAYELGQSTLSQVVVTRRETALARLALLDARLTVQRMRLALDMAAGTLP